MTLTWGPLREWLVAPEARAEDLFHGLPAGGRVPAKIAEVLEQLLLRAAGRKDELDQ
jgi:hypothetical protein